MTDNDNARSARRAPSRTASTQTTERIPRRAPVKVVIAQQPGGEPLALLEQALQSAGFWQHIARAQRASGETRRGLRIVIKPDLDFFAAHAPGGTEPALVEHLIDLLHDREYRNVAVAEGRNEPDGWLHNRDPMVVPELVGYQFHTAKGRVYEIADLCSGLPEAGASNGSASCPISTHWSEAAFRINFAKNRTHEDCVFALCVHNLAGIAAGTDANARSRLRTTPDACLEILRRAPPHFNIIDAFDSGHGGAGHRAPRALATHTFIASPDALLADWAGAAKMGADPYASPVNAAALRNIGLPARYEVIGDLAPYPLWRNVHPLIAHLARLRNASDALGPIAAAWFQDVDRERFALRDFYNDRINAMVAPLMTRIDDNPRTFWIVVLVNYAIARIDAALAAQNTLFSKGRLRRRVAPLTLDPAHYAPADYDAIATYLAPYQQLLERFPANRLGLRWRHVDGAIVFSGAHVFPIDFERFTRTVDIARAIQYMNDYIGGSTLAVQHDRRGRIVHQVERNLYLQQPNWMVLFGGALIDVEKLEAIRYGKDRQTLYWRTVRSANDSARHDDGSVSFIRTGTGQTTVEIFARQQFSLPLFFQVFDVDMLPGVRDPIVERAYTTFFTGTLANLQAAYEGRAFRIGHDPVEHVDAAGATGDLPRYLATAAAAIAELLRHRGDVADFSQWLAGNAPTAGGPANASQTDQHGFRHFEAPGKGADGSKRPTSPAARGRDAAIL
ncbi:MAG: DUF362 domain-containing protein, partial [Proteobacteria bacterium]|nr:DUF362 domain-containing protein [Burkholderiales bacterium]